MSELKTLFQSDLLAGLRELKDELGSWYQIAMAGGGAGLVDGLEFVQLWYHSEGDGNPCFSVVSFKLDGKHLGDVRFTGTYSSWDDTEWDDELTLVEARQVVTTVYVATDGSEDHKHRFL
jgi:hypothetical protein